MKQIKFGNYKSFDDLYLVLTSKEIGSPKIKSYKVNIEGGDGVLDYTDFFGGTHYDNLTLKFEFNTVVQPALEYFSQVKKILHGKKMQIVLDDDPNFYYIGRLSVSSLKNKKNINNLTITCDCDPYKYKKDITVVTTVISGVTKIILSNMEKKVVPTITSSATMRFDFPFEDHFASVQHTAGTFKIPEMELVEGNNEIEVYLTESGATTGTVTFSYQEGGF